MQDPDTLRDIIHQFEIVSSRSLEGVVPKLIDERQIAPILWDAVVFEVNRMHAVGQFIITASSVPKDDQVMHSGSGRIARMTMQPMTLY